MGVKTEMVIYEKYVAKCKKKGVKPMDLIDFIIMVEGN